MQRTIESVTAIRNHGAESKTITHIKNIINPGDHAKTMLAGNWRAEIVVINREVESAFIDDVQNNI